MGKPMHALCSLRSASNPAETLRHVGEPGEQTQVAPLHPTANPKCGMNNFLNYIAAIELRQSRVDNMFVSGSKSRIAKGPCDLVAI